MKLIRLFISSLLTIIVVSTVALSQVNINTSNSYLFDNISIKEGLSNSEVKSLCQDSLGYIWIGTDRGLNRFDGNQIEAFSSFSNDEQIKHNSIWGLYALNDAVVFETIKGIYYYDLCKESLRQIVDNSHFYYYDNGCVWQGGFFNILQDSVLLKLNKETLDFNPVNSFPDSLKITNIYADSENGIWCVRAQNRNLVLFNPNTGNVEFYDLATINKESVINDLKNINEYLWVATSNGLQVFNYKNQAIFDDANISKLLLTLENFDIRFIEEKDNEIWIGTYKNGLFIYNSENNSIQQVWQSDFESDLKTNNLTASVIDWNNNVWLGTFNKGVHVTYSNRKKFNPDLHLNRLTKNKFVNCILTDKNGVYYIGTRYSGIITFDPKTLKSKNYNSVNSGLLSNHITSLFFDSAGKLWIGQINLLQTFNPDSKVFKAVELPEGNSEVVSINEFNNNIYTCGLNQITVYGLNGTMVEELTDFGRNIRQTIKINDSQMLVCGHGDVRNLESRLLIYTPATNTIESIIPNESLPAMEEQYFITTFIDSDSILWIGSFYSGLLKYDFDNNTMDVFNKNHGLPSNDVIGITEDDDGNLWLSTYYGLSCFDKEGTFTNYFIDEGLNNQQFHQKAVYKQKDGTIFFGGYSGITYFKPKEVLKKTENSPKTILKSLNIDYESVFPSDHHKVLKEGLPYTSSIALTHRQRTFSIDYIALNYGLAHKNEYAYMLEGYNDEWINAGNSTRAVYSNLRPGDYIFKVKARNSESGWSNTAVLTVKVKQTPWLNTWAMALYILVFMSMVVVTFWLILNAKLYKKDLDVEHAERIREHDIHQMKIKFFTNISHEIRTPLTVISAMTYMLFKQLKPEGDTKKLFDSLSLNVDRLLRLINQLLLFREMENDVLELNFAKIKIKDVLNNTHKTFLHFATVKNISFQISNGSLDEDTSIICDYDKVEKIMANILSNAMKNTPKHGSVSLFCEKCSTDKALSKYVDLGKNNIPISESGYIEFRVADTGIGIAEDELPFVFDRYRKIERKKSSDYSGTGIGLDFTKRLINLHNGDIRVESKVKHGTTFSFILPYGNNVYKGEQVPEYEKETFYINDVELDEEGVDQTQNKDEKKFKIAVVEDNVELCDLIMKIFSHKYHVITANDGLEGLNLIKSELPDLIISDVMMPGMDGLSLCEKVKENKELNHIYLILLSAKSEAGDQIRGIEKGADIYINKPFNIDYLLAVVDAHFIRRQRLNRDFRKGIAPKINEGQENQEYREFIQELNDKLHMELSNENLNVQMLAEHLNMSRAKFYRKFESVTGISPNSYIVKFRINKAVELMDTSGYSVAEISELVGFPNSAYFATIFKKEKGIPPSQYIKKKSNRNSG